MGKLNQHSMMASIASDETVFRVHRAQDRDKLRAVVTKPRRNSSLKTKRNQYQGNNTNHMMRHCKRATALINLPEYSSQTPVQKR